MDNGVLTAVEGKSIWVIGDRYTIKCGGNDTSGAFPGSQSIEFRGHHTRFSTACSRCQFIFSRYRGRDRG
jgi:hypothetical protein